MVEWQWLQLFVGKLYLCLCWCAVCCCGEQVVVEDVGGECDCCYAVVSSWSFVSVAVNLVFGVWCVIFRVLLNVLTLSSGCSVVVVRLSAVSCVCWTVLVCWVLIGMLVNMVGLDCCSLMF